MSEFTSPQKQFLSELFTQMTDTFNKQSRDIKEELKQQIGDLKNEVQTIRRTYEDKVTKLEEKNINLEKQVVDLDRKVRKNNLVFYGVKQSNNIQNTILSLISASLNIDISERDINEIYYLGSRDKQKTPILVELLSYQKKTQILKNGYKLKEQGIFINHDESTKDRAIKKTLLKHRWLARQKGLQAHIKGYKLLVGKELFTVEQLETTSDSPQKSNSAPTTPNQFGLEENDHQRENKKCRPSNSTTKTVKTTSPRILRSNTNSAEPSI